MDILKLIGIAICSVAANMAVREYKREFALVISLVSGAIILVMAINMVTPVFDSINRLCTKYSLDTGHISIIIKIIAISYLTQFASGICSDAGEKNLSSKVELAGRIMIASCVIPIAISVMETIENMIESV